MQTGTATVSVGEVYTFRADEYVNTVKVSAILHRDGEPLVCYRDDNAPVDGVQRGMPLEQFLERYKKPEPVVINISQPAFYPVYQDFLNSLGELAKAPQCDS